MLDFPNLVLSYHNFQETPENMMEILSELTILNPKLVKVAVMAHTEQDVLDLMNYTRGFKTLNPEQEYVTISMGKVGKVSRITADVPVRVGLCQSDEVSAPGQISLASMKKKSGRFWMKLDGYTRLAAVVANPIKHSISPSSTIEPLRRQLPTVLMWLGRLKRVTWQKQWPIFVATRCLASICPCPIRSR